MIYGRVGSVYNITFKNNVVHDMCRGANIWGDAPVTGLKFLNNTFVNMDQSPIELHNAPNAVVENNIFYNIADTYMDLDPASQSNSIGNNLTYRTSGSYSTDVVGTDPRFADVSGGDHLQSNSPAIDAGVALPEVNDDRDGVPRPQGTGYDIGAFGCPIL